MVLGCGQGPLLQCAIVASNAIRMKKSFSRAQWNPRFYAVEKNCRAMKVLLARVAAWMKEGNDITVGLICMCL
jgi:hypothetical protein